MTAPVNGPVPRPGPHGFMRPSPPPVPAGHSRSEPVDDAGGDHGEDHGENGGGSGHPAVDNMVRALGNAAQLGPGDQVAEYEAAHRVLQETLASIDRT